jgi:hypothetical protein
MSEILKESLSKLIARNIERWSCEIDLDEMTPEQVADQIITLLPSQTTSLEEVGDADSRNDRAVQDFERLIEHAHNLENAQYGQDYQEMGPSKVIGDAEKSLPAIRTALADTGWRDISTAPKDGTKFIARRDDVVRTTWATDHYDKWPHQEGGPTYRKAWSYIALDALMQWRPTHWKPLDPPPLTREEG